MYLLACIFAILLPNPLNPSPLFDKTSDPVVNLTLGSIRGSVLQSRLGEPFFAFRGIRYAEPPIDSLRFQPPQPVKAWNGILDATQDGPMCPQPSNDPSDISEDCLRLNIYTRAIPGDLAPVRRPVLVYIHPGGFYSVSGQSKNFAGPQSLMDRDIVLVTFNYRLGSLGFMATGTKDCPGNMGLKDQVLVLRWIRDHIAAFGGDPHAVTLMGYSAGGMSVILHMVSPMSKGLFHRAIVMSGAATAQWDIPYHQLELARRQARVFGCSEESPNEILACLKNVSAEDLGESLSEMFEFSYNPIILWKPVIELDFGQERFLTQDPVQMFQLGLFMRVPVIAGVTKDEFAGPAVAILKNISLTQEMDDNFKKWAPICFLYERNSKQSTTISNILRKEYLPGPLMNDSSLPGLNYLFADGVIGFGVHRFVQLAKKFTTVFYYKHTFQGRFSHLYYPANKPYGVVHHDDLLYLFVAPQVAPMFRRIDPENLHVERMTRMWASFAHFGSTPVTSFDPLIKDIVWTPTSARESYLDIGETPIMRTHMFKGRYEIWDALFPLSTAPKVQFEALSVPLRN